MAGERGASSTATGQRPGPSRASTAPCQQRLRVVLVDARAVYAARTRPGPARRPRAQRGDAAGAPAGAPGGRDRCTSARPCHAAAPSSAERGRALSLGSESRRRESRRIFVSCDMRSRGRSDDKLGRAAEARGAAARARAARLLRLLRRVEARRPRCSRRTATHRRRRARPRLRTPSAVAAAAGRRVLGSSNPRVVGVVEVDHARFKVCSIPAPTRGRVKSHETTRVAAVRNSTHQSIYRARSGSTACAS